MAFDFKKEYKEFYLPKNKPGIVDVPPMNYIAVRGKGNPNEADGEYKQAVGLLYAIAYTIKMSYKGDHKIDSYFEYVVPPLEGFWWQDGIDGVDYSDKSSLTGFPLSGFPILSRSTTLSGRKLRPKGRKSLTAKKRSF